VAPSVAQAGEAKPALFYHVDRSAWRAGIALADMVPGFEAEARELDMTLETSIEVFAMLARGLRKAFTPRCRAGWRLVPRAMGLAAAEHRPKHEEYACNHQHVAHTVSDTADTILKASYFASPAAASSIVGNDMFGLVFIPNGRQAVGRVPKTPASWPLCRRMARSRRRWGVNGVATSHLPGARERAAPMWRPLPRRACVPSQGGMGRGRTVCPRSPAQWTPCPSAWPSSSCSRTSTWSAGDVQRGA
jgi:hypothetical protein